MLLRVIQRSSCEMLRGCFGSFSFLEAVYLSCRVLYSYLCFCSCTNSTAVHIAQQELQFYTISLAPGILLFHLAPRIASQLTKHCFLKLPCKQELKSNMNDCNQIQRLNHDKANHCGFGTCSVLLKQKGNWLFHHSPLIT